MPVKAFIDLRLSPFEVVKNEKYEEIKTDEFPNEIDEENDIKNSIKQY